MQKSTKKKNIRLKRSVKRKINRFLDTVLVTAVALIGAIGMVAMMIGASIQEQEKLSSMAVMEVRND